MRARVMGHLPVSSVPYRVEAQSGGDCLRRLFRGEPASGAGLGTIGEGLAALWRLSRADTRLGDLSDDLALRLRCTAGRTVDRQVGATEARAYPRPDLVRGAWFTEDDYTQMDHQRHPLSSLLATIPVLVATQAG